MLGIDIKELQNWQLEGKDFVLIDVREPFEHEQFNIGGSNIPLNEIIVSIGAVANQDSAIVLYCAKGIRSLIAIQRLEQKGYSNLYNLSGGLAALT